MLKDAISERSFRVCLAQDGTTTSVNFVSGNSDGLHDPDSGASSQSTGVIPDINLFGDPQEIWPAAFPGSPIFTLDTQCH